MGYALEQIRGITSGMRAAAANLSKTFTDAGMKVATEEDAADGKLGLTVTDEGTGNTAKLKLSEWECLADGWMYTGTEIRVSEDDGFGVQLVNIPSSDSGCGASLFLAPYTGKKLNEDEALDMNEKMQGRYEDKCAGYAKKVLQQLRPATP